MLLSINTSQDKYKFGLYDEPHFARTWWATRDKRDDKKDPLYFIAQFLKENRVKIADLKAIAVYNGAGSYTGVRVGVTIANALSYSLNIPVFGFKHKIMSDKLVKDILEKIEKKKYKIGKYVKPVY